jgi:colanic acid/amylovoran biosynthesis glycosyltransferase
VGGAPERVGMNRPMRTDGPTLPLDSAPRGDVRNGGRPRILYFINVFPNLIETMIYREVDALRRCGYDLRTFSIRRPDDGDVPPEAIHHLSTTRYILPLSVLHLIRRHLLAIRRWPARYWKLLLRLLWARHESWRDRVRTMCHFVEAVTVLPEVEALNVDHIHAHWAVGSTTCAMVLAEFLDLEFSFTAHAYDIWRERLLLPEKLAAARFVVTCTEYNREHLASTYGTAREKIHAVHHGVNLDRFRPVNRRGPEVPVIISVGRLVEQKGLDRLLRACAKLAASGVHFRCDVVGDGPLRESLERLARDLGISDRVAFRGKVFQDDLIAMYAEANLFALMCMPAEDDDRDGIPNVLIEAMATQLPVVSTRFSGVPELVTPETGILLEVEDLDGQVEALRTLLADHELRRRMGEAARRRVAEAFTIEASAKRMDEVFSQWIDRSRQASAGATAA